MAQRPINDFVGVLRDSSEGTEIQLRQRIVDWALAYSDDGVPAATINKILNGTPNLTKEENEFLERQGIKFQLKLAKDDGKRTWAIRVAVPTGDADRKQWQDIALVRKPGPVDEDGETPDILTLHTTGYEDGELENGHFDGDLPLFVTELITEGSPEILDTGGRKLTSRPRIFSRPIDQRARQERRDPLLAMATTIAFNRSSLPVIVFSLPRSVDYNDGEGEQRTKLATELAAKLAGQARVIVLQRPAVVGGYQAAVGEIRAPYQEGVTIHFPTGKRPIQGFGFGKNSREDLEDVGRRITECIHDHAVRKEERAEPLFDFGTLTPPRQQGKLSVGGPAGEALARAAAAEAALLAANKERAELEARLRAEKARADSATAGMQTTNAAAAQAREAAAAAEAENRRLAEELEQMAAERDGLISRTVRLFGAEAEATRQIVGDSEDLQNLKEGLSRLATGNVIVIGQGEAKKAYRVKDTPESLRPERIKEFLSQIPMGDGRTAADNIEFTKAALDGFVEAAGDASKPRDIAQIYAAITWLAIQRSDGLSIDQQKTDLRIWTGRNTGVDPSYAGKNPDARFVTTHEGKKTVAELHLQVRDDQQSRVYYTRLDPAPDAPKGTRRKVLITHGPEHL